MTLPTLITIPVSHYCERARWGLELVGIPFAERRHLQGFHRRALARVGGGKQVPVLVTSKGLVEGSAAILDWAAERSGDPRLARPPGELAALEGELEGPFGIETRRLAYASLLGHPELLLPFNNRGAPLYQRVVLRLTYRRVAPMIARALQLDPDRVERGRAIVDATFDRVANLLADGRPYLAGDRFGRLDLSFAALAAPLVLPAGYAGGGAPALARLPAEVRAALKARRAHRAGAHVLDCYARHRAAG